LRNWRDQFKEVGSLDERKLKSISSRKVLYCIELGIRFRLSTNLDIGGFNGGGTKKKIVILDL
jgi:hypothetical protein